MASTGSKSGVLQVARLRCVGPKCVRFNQQCMEHCSAYLSLARSLLHSTSDKGRYEQTTGTPLSFRSAAQPFATRRGLDIFRVGASDTPHHRECTALELSKTYSPQRQPSCEMFNATEAGGHSEEPVVSPPVPARRIKHQHTLTNAELLTVSS